MSIWEECAAIAESIECDGPEYPFDNGGTRDGWRMACQKVAELIRQRAAETNREWPVGPDGKNLTMTMSKFQNISEWYDALIGAKARARLNNRKVAYAVQWPDGHCTVEDNKPMLRNHDMRVIECDCSGGEYLA